MEPQPDNAEQQAQVILSQTFDAEAEMREIMEAAIETLPFVFAMGALSELEMAMSVLQTRVRNAKATTAEEIAERLGIDIPEGIAIGEMPGWLRAAAARAMGDAFDEPYWQEIPETTRDDIGVTLMNGIRDGHSMQRVARDINRAHGGAYSLMRAMRVARTEIPNALNGGHAEGMRRLQEETGIQMGKEWVSVLGSTTRNSHANMDGQQTEDPDGLFSLGGVEVPWPAHQSLPARERINCQCTIVSALVMDQTVPEEDEEPRDPGKDYKIKGGDKDQRGQVDAAFGDLKQFKGVDEYLKKSGSVIELRSDLADSVYGMYEEGRKGPGRLIVKDSLRHSPELKMGRDVWAVDTSLQGTVRHEFGHQFWFKNLTEQERIDFGNKFEEMAGLFVDTNDISKYSASNISELWAESFSAYTSPQYKGGLPKDIEDILKKKLGPRPKPKVKPKKKPPKDIPPLKDLEFVQRLGGSTGAGKYRDRDGNFYVIKKGSSEEHLIEEYIAEELYRAGGVKIPDSKLTVDSEGRATKVSRWIEGEDLKDLPWHTGPQAGASPDQKKTFAKMRKDFGLDALFANWDVAGLDMDNVKVDADGNAYRIDLGGALRFRAQGSPKGPLFTDNVLELWSLRDAERNPQSAKMFNMGNKAVRSSVKKTLRKRKAIMKRLGELERQGVVSGDLRRTLDARFDSLQEYTDTSEAMLADKWKDGYVEDFARHEMQMRQAGVFSKFPQELTTHRSASIAYSLRDENGKEFDHLRDHADTPTERLSTYLRQQGIEYEDIAKYADSQAGSSWSERAVINKMHLALSRDVPLDRYYWGQADPDVQAAIAKGPKAVEKLLQKKIGENFENNPHKFRQAMIAQHGMTYNLLKKVDLPNSDRVRGVISLGRTESRNVVERYGMTSKGDVAKMQRGICESFGLTNTVDVSGSHMTYQEIPHTRIIGTYMQERGPKGSQKGRGMFLGDGENEFVAMAEGVESMYDGSYMSGSVILPPEEWKKKAKKPLKEKP